MISDRPLTQPVESGQDEPDEVGRASGRPPSRASSRGSIQRRVRDLLEWAVLAAPGFLLYFVLIIGSLAVAVYYSLTNWTGVSSSFDFVGLKNYFDIPANPNVGTSFIMTFEVAIGATIATNLLALPLAVLLNRSGFVTRVYRSILLYPVVLAPLVVGVIYANIFGTSGALDIVEANLGLPQTTLLADPTQAVIALAFLCTWQTLSLCTILYLAGLQTIPTDIVEAAEIDGANSWQRFRHITVPLLAPTMTVNVVLLMIWFMRTYDYVVGMTGGGPAGATTTVAFLLLGEAFNGFRYGFASAIAIVLLAVSIILAGIIFVLSRRREAFL